MQSGPLGKFVLIGGPEGRWEWNSPNAAPPYETGIDAWALALKGARIGGTPPAEKELDGFDTVMANADARYVKAYLPLVENHPSRQRWITLIEGDARSYLEPSRKLRRLFDASDVIVTINAHTSSFFRSITSSRVVNAGVPYPFEEVRKLRSAVERVPAAMVCNKEEIQLSIAVAVAAGLKPVVFGKRVSRQVGSLRYYASHQSFDKDLALRLLGEELHPVKAQVLPRNRDWRSFIETAQQYGIWINIDPRYTWGRYVLDAAALEMPIVTTASTVHGSHLFPETTLENPFDSPKGGAMARRLMDDATFARDVSAYALARIETYRPEKAVARLCEALG